MKILLVHNAYGKFSGEESVFKTQKKLLIEKGHEVIIFERSSAEINKIKFGKFKSFFSGIYNMASSRRIKEILLKEEPDIVHIHNLYPLISSSILPVCKAANIPIIMTVHNYRLICPNGLLFQKQKQIVCEKCVKGSEIHCVVNNCENSTIKSLGYALRGWYSRTQRHFFDNINIYACISEFQKKKLVEAGYPIKKLIVIPNMVDNFKSSPSYFSGNYVGYVGRTSPEKGVNVLLKAAKLVPEIPINILGNHDFLDSSIAPKNVKFFGHLEGRKLREFYQGCRFLVFPSIWYETFGLSLVEAALYGKPVVASNIGGIPEIVLNGTTGILFEMGNSDDLARKIKALWQNEELCKNLGQSALINAQKKYSKDVYYNKLFNVYENAIGKIREDD